MDWPPPGLAGVDWSRLTRAGGDDWQPRMCYTYSTRPGCILFWLGTH